MCSSLVSHDAVLHSAFCKRAPGGSKAFTCLMPSTGTAHVIDFYSKKCFLKYRPARQTLKSPLSRGPTVYFLL